MNKMTIYFHLPGLFEFYDFYSVFLPLFREHREYFYDWCEIGSIYGAPADCLWGGGRAGFGECNTKVVLKLMNEYNISPRLTFSNSLLREEHLSDKRCNDLCEIFYKESKAQSGIISRNRRLCIYPGSGIADGGSPAKHRASRDVAESLHLRQIQRGHTLFIGGKQHPAVIR